ncbi:hypothetical protein BIU98_02605 [Curtobacterium sp. MMLR14_010]|uniref:hypothetical protein n=1 Tax=Curtobacterium sp. MMLR14_010 TaxID=1898743 RepID=UPI0008DD09B5|nr:hypothetical protein [Curtobacterium sp. MMLR14_010]OII34866.1 hypothetical protein BIU98_02605 [Curtobacterium sp. MMLR14_010]
MDLIGDPGRGSWLLARAGDAAQVGGIAGTGFEAHARILHPLTAVLEDRTTIDEHGDHLELDEVRWRWADVAARTGTTMRPLVTWSAVSGRDDESDVSFPDGWRVSPPEEGWFDPVVLAALTDHLTRATSTPGDLVAGFWDGRSDFIGGSTLGFGWQGDEAPTAEERDELRGWMAERTASHRREQDAVVASLSVPRFAWPGRDLILAATDLSTLADPTWLDHARLGPLVPLLHTPQMLWPEDRAWVMASEIDWDSTIVAGSRSLVDGVLADERLEAFEVDEDSGPS